LRDEGERGIGEGCLGGESLQLSKHEKDSATSLKSFLRSQSRIDPCEKKEDFQDW